MPRVVLFLGGPLDLERRILREREWQVEVHVSSALPSVDFAPDPTPSAIPYETIAYRRAGVIKSTEGHSLEVFTPNGDRPTQDEIMRIFR